MVTPLMAQFAYGTKWNISRLRLHSRASDELQEDGWDAIPRGPPQQAVALPDALPVAQPVLGDQQQEVERLPEEPVRAPGVERRVLPQRNRRPPQPWRDY